MDWSRSRWCSQWPISGRFRRFRASTSTCTGNAVGEPRTEPPPTVQGSHGLLSCTEWTGVPLSVLLAHAKVKPDAKWGIAEGADNCRMARSIPLEKCLKDTLVVYGQNGEALRPEQGYPLRLIVPGWEGNVNVKWLHRLHIADQAAMSVKETAIYTELMPNGKAQIFTFEIEARSVITRPSGGQHFYRVPRACNYRARLDWQGEDQASRGFDGWREDLVRRAIAAGAFAGGRSFPICVAMGWQRGGAAIAMYG